jgi:Zn-dependent peptidase ImmA (M78 family)/transcriptional regulator with XRE-family HTH domain
MTKDQLIGGRLRQEREALNFTLRHVATQLGFKNYQTLSSIESGERPVKAWELMKLAQTYHRDVEFFLMPRQKEQQQQKVLWREPSRTAKTMLAERKLLSFCQNFGRLTDLAGEAKSEPHAALLPVDQSKLRREQFRYVSKLAEDYRRYLDLGGRPACALPAALENRLGILVLYLDLEDAGSAAATSGSTGHAILVNSADIPWRRNYDLGHEFFHVVTWGRFSDSEIYETPRNNKKSLAEQLADAFASTLLLPADEVREQFLNKLEDGKVTYASLIEIAREFDVSTDALLWRLVNLKLLSREEVIEALGTRVLKEMERERRTKSLAGEGPYLSARYINLAIKAFLMGQVSKARFAEYVGIPFSEVPLFLEKWGYDEDEDYTIAYSAT